MSQLADLWRLFWHTRTDIQRGLILAGLVILAALAITLAIRGCTPEPVTPADKAQAVLDSAETDARGDTDATVDEIVAPIVIDSTETPEESLCRALPETC